MYKSLSNASLELLCAETSLWDLKDRPAHTSVCVPVHEYTRTHNHGHASGMTFTYYSSALYILQHELDVYR